LPQQGNDLLGFETSAMFGYLHTIFLVKNYQNLSFGLVLKINAGQFSNLQCDSIFWSIDR
jgi:hypothetical protein